MHKGIGGMMPGLASGVVAQLKMRKAPNVGALNKPLLIQIIPRPWEKVKS
jgi:hypothetical protein